MSEMISWDKVKKHNPNSYKLFMKWDSDVNEGNLERICQRELFDFFDERDLLVQITFARGKFGYIIKSSYLEMDIINEESFNGRSKAEIKAWENCFHLLEAIIADDKGENLTIWN